MTVAWITGVILQVCQGFRTSITLSESRAVVDEKHNVKQCVHSMFHSMLKFAAGSRVNLFGLVSVRSCASKRSAQ